MPRSLVRSVAGDTMHIAGIKTALQSGFVVFRGNLLKYEATATKFDRHIPVLAHSTPFTVKFHYLQMQRPQYVIDPSRLDTLSFENGTKHLQIKTRIANAVGCHMYPPIWYSRSTQL